MKTSTIKQFIVLTLYNEEIQEMALFIKEIKISKKG